MKKILPLFHASLKLCWIFFAAFIFQSCCIRHKTFAQSDRFDTHRPNFPVIECIPCAGLHNVHEHFSWIEVMGPSGSYTAGLELGHNFDHLRMYGSAGISYWPYRAPQVTLTGQLGIVAMNPDNKLRPELGAGISDWWVNGDKENLYRLHPSMKSAMVNPGNYSCWQVYAGARIAIPFSSVNLSLRIYRLETFKSPNYTSWYPGIVCGFRF
jgi:hypothetical protein